MEPIDLKLLVSGYIQGERGNCTYPVDRNEDDEEVSNNIGDTECLKHGRARVAISQYIFQWKPLRRDVGPASKNYGKGESDSPDTYNHDHGDRGNIKYLAPENATVEKQHG